MGVPSKVLSTVLMPSGHLLNDLQIVLRNGAQDLFNPLSVTRHDMFAVVRSDGKA